MSRMATLTLMKPLAVSERSAGMLLAAWNSGDAARIEAAMNQPVSQALSCGERERLDLVRGIAGAMRESHPDLNVALGLLRHLCGAANCSRP